MENDQALNDFAVQVQQEIMDLAITKDMLQTEAFTQYMIDTLIEAGELGDGIACYHKARGLEVSGYYLDDEDTLNLFTTIYTQATPPEIVGKNEIETGFKRLSTFLQKSLEQYYLSLEESSQVFDMADNIFMARKDIVRVRLFLFTDSLTTVNKLVDAEVSGLPVSYHIWDILRLHRYASSGKSVEPIHINFVEQFGRSLPCLQASDDATGYSAYLTVIPGDILGSLYGYYGSRLLELNVRSYLQAKGKVNKGIQQTIQNQPERFLAYNNGISATASEIELERLSEGGIGIRSLSNLQIVNGGQTTASIFYTARKYKADISRLRIQAKISVVTSEDIVDLVPLISRYANSQNKVNEADFNANDPFHVQLETLSRSIWAPAVDGTQHQTKWFYERARGQYQDALTRSGTPARQKQFKDNHPTTQKFTKTDLAKFEMTWMQLPHIVSLGAQKCFIQFNAQLQKREHFEVGPLYFYHLVAKTILFHQAEKIIGGLKFGGYRANIVTYTLAYILHHTGGRIDLDRIWQQQCIGKGLAATIEIVSKRVQEVIVSPPDGKNVTEWCKREACWNRIRDLSIDLPALLNDDLLQSTHREINKNIESFSNEDQQRITQATAVHSETWYQLAAWAKETRNLQHEQRRLAFRLGRIRQVGAVISIKQAEQGLLMLQEAYRLGFKPALDQHIAD